MATLTAWKFPTADGASRASAKLMELSKQHLVTIEDAAVVEWPPDRKGPKTRQAHDLVASGALGGAFWGMLFGLIFFVPLLGLLVGAAAGALGGALTDIGIDDDFIASVRDEITPGTSALFLLTEEVVGDRVAEAFEGVDVSLIHTSLSKDDEARLREMFG